MASWRSSRAWLTRCVAPSRCSGQWPTATRVCRQSTGSSSRQIITDTLGLLVGAEIQPADVQDRDGAALVIGAIHDLFPWLRHLFADSAYSGGGLGHAIAKFGHWTIEVVRRRADVAGFAVLPRRWVVERTLAWLNRNHRLAKDFEASLASAKAWLYLGSIQLLIRRLARA